MSVSTAQHTDQQKPTREKKDDKINIRVTQQTKALFDKAAELEGLNTTAFIVNTVAKKAREVIKDHEQLVLSERDFMSFLDALDNPPEPNEALRRAAKKYA